MQSERPANATIAPTTDPFNSSNHPFDFYYPKAKSTGAKLKTYFKHKKLPRIMIIHHTAGHQDQRASDFTNWLSDMGLATWFLDNRGQVWQDHPGNEVGYHIGVHPKIKGKRIYKEAGGIEIASGGLLDDDGVTWFKRKINNNEVREVSREEGYEYPGKFQKFTQAQEKELALFLKWALDNGTEIILGHDELLPNPKWKNDPSGCLSLPLHEWLKKYVY